MRGKRTYAPGREWDQEKSDWEVPMGFGQSPRAESATSIVKSKRRRIQIRAKFSGRVGDRVLNGQGVGPAQRIESGYGPILPGGP